MRKKPFVPWFVALMIFLPACSRSGDLTRIKLIEDVDTYVGYIREVHADPWRLTTEAEFLAKAEEVKKRIRALDDDTIPIFDAYFYLEELAAAIQDGHTGINLPMRQFTGSEPVFPFALQVIGDEVFVVRKWGEDPVPLFSRILEVDRVPIETYRVQIHGLTNSSLAHVRDLIFEQTFRILLGMYFKKNPPWEVTYQHESRVRTVEVQGMSIGEYLPQVMGEEASYRESSITVDEREIPVLDIPNFTFGEREDYDAFIDGFFEKHAKSEYLVIDLRENPGGSGFWGYDLLDCLVDTPYLITKDFTFKVSDPMRRSQYADKAGDLLRDAKNGEYLTIQRDRMQTPHENSGRFGGQVFCLISERTFSAGVVTAAIFQANGMGVTVGQETSGRVKFCSDPITMTLPNTKLAAQIPVAVYELPGGDPDRGVIPDVKVVRTIDDYRSGIDKEMEAVKELIKEMDTKNY